MSEDTVNEWLDHLAERLKQEIEGGAAPAPERLTVRQLLSNFGYARRGRWVVSEIREQLGQRGLRTSPDFEFEYVDDWVSVEMDLDVDSIAPEGKVVDPTVRVGILPAAHNPPVRVAPDDLIEKATTLMRMEDYSQLPVMTTPRTVKGMVSWRSIGMAYAHRHSPKRVRDCMDQAQMVDTKTPLTDATDSIHKHGYVLVLGANNEITGIVTATDLADQFKQLAHPFLLIAEIEHHLRNLLRRKYTVGEFAQASNGDKQVRGPDDLTFGDYCRLLQEEQAWSKLGVAIDRVEFLKRLDDVRSIRNDIMHFSPESHEPSDLRKLERIAQFFRTVARLESGQTQ